MIKITDIKAPLDYNDSFIHKTIAKRLKIKNTDILSFELFKKSVDARKKNAVHFNLSIIVKMNDEQQILSKCKDNTVTYYETFVYPTPKSYEFPKRPVVIGSGPAGLFCSLILAEAGAKPILLERGMDADSRKKAVNAFWKNGILDTECNVQFGEGGSGTFSDGKLTTGTKDKRIRTVFEKFVEFGAPKEILYLAKPHIGTDMLISTIKTMRQKIISLGGEVIFEAKFCDFESHNNQLTGIYYEKDGKKNYIETNNAVLAVGHSARDVLSLLFDKGIKLSQKNFAVGMRIEHLQFDINKALYGDFATHKALSAADYKLVTHLPNGRSLYTFCMCPGGYVVAAASEAETVVTNGMSLFSRDGKNANSALLVGVAPSDFGSDHPLAGVELQRKIERAAYISGGKNYNAPIILTGDFIKGVASSSFGKITPTYTPSVTFANPYEYLPEFVCDTIRQGLPLLGQRIYGFDSPDAVLTGAESRSSSPVRIDRNEKCCSVSLGGLYPCGEGAGYAGGIVSSAVDGIRCAESILENR